MASRLKEDEKNERVIRNLLKLPDNRRCINCNSLGPQYVCTNFSTFVCTTCSGIHREFTHRVKSVSMAKFTSQEVSALQGGGNASAKEIYLKEWDPQRNSLPDTSNVERLRNFIKHVYVDRRYTGEQRVENKVTDSNQGGSRSPPYDRERPSPGGRSDDRNPRNSYNERRSPGFDQGSPPYNNTRSPIRTGVVNDWRREDRFSNGMRSDDGNLSDGSSKFEGRSPEHQNMSSPPVVRPVREILGDNVVPLRIIGPPKANGSRTAGGSLGGQVSNPALARNLSSNSLASSNGNPAEIKRENSLIDFDAVSEPPPPPAAPTAEVQQSTVVQTVTQPTASANDNWAFFDSSPAVKTSEAPPANKNSLESLFGDLSVSAPVPAQTTGNNSSISQSPFGDDLLGGPVGQMSASPFGDGAPAAVSANNLATSPPVGATVGQVSMPHYGVGVSAVTTASNFKTLPAGGASVGVLPGAHGQTATFPPNGVNAFMQVGSGVAQSNTGPFQPFTPAVSGSSSNQPWSIPVPGNTQGFSFPAGQTSQALPKPGSETQSSSADTIPSGRKELPSDLFAATYPSPALVPAWQTGPHQGYGFNMQYNNVMPMPTYPLQAQSTNPFDNEATPAQAPMFPPMGPLHGAMPNVAAPGGFHGAPSLWMAPQSSYPPSLHQQAPNNFSGGFVGQQIPSNLPARQPGVIGFGNDGSGLGPRQLGGPNQQLGGFHPMASNANTFSSAGGNPFG